MLLLCIIPISFLFLIYCSIYLSIYHTYFKGQLWSWSYDSWIYNYLCSQCLSLLMLWVWIPLSHGVLDTTLCDKVYQWLAACQWFSPDTGTPVSSTNKNWLPGYNWNVVESGLNTIKHNPTLYCSYMSLTCDRSMVFSGYSGFSTKKKLIATI